MAQAPDFAAPEFAILVLTPAGSADAALAIAACRAGHLGLFNAELPLAPGALEAGLEALASATDGGFGVSWRMRASRSISQGALARAGCR